MQLIPNALAQFIDSSGAPLASGSVGFYFPGTLNPKATFQDMAGTIANPNPVPLNSRGQALIWGSGVYRQIVKDASGVTIWDQITEDPNSGLTGNIADAVFVAGTDFTPGTTTQLTLPANPGSITNTWIFFDAAYQDDAQATVNGTTLTFANPIPVGIGKVTVKIGTTVAIGTPSNGTVTDATVASGAAIQSTKLAFIQNGPGAVSRTIQAKLAVSVYVEDFGAKGDGTTDDTAAINAAEAFVASQGGGTVNFMAKTYCHTGLIKQDSNVHWKGAGSDTPHDGGAGGVPATTLKYIGVAGGACVTVQTPQSTSVSMKVGMDIVGISIDGNSAAATGLLIISVRNCRFEDLFVTGVSGTAYLISTFPRSTMAEASDTQQCTFSRCTWRLLAPFSNTATGMHLAAAGDNGTALANTSFNIFEMCEGQNAAGYGFLLGDCDNNTLIACRVIRTNLAVPGVLFQGGDNNYFWGLSSGGALGVVINGASEGAFHTPVANAFYAMDTGNGTPYPTLGVGVTINGPMWEYTLLTTTATAGGNGAPPAQVAGYIDIHLPTGGKAKVPYYNE